MSILRLIFGKKKTKYILSIILILVSIIMIGNTNNNPTIFILRIFKPIKIDTATFYYASVFPLISIYFGLKGMNKFGNHNWLKSGTKRFVVFIIILSFSNNLINFSIKRVKSMYTDLNSIYYDRKLSNRELTFKNDKNNKAIINCKITLENCSEKDQEFYIKVIAPEFFKDFIVEKEFTAKDAELLTDKKFILHGKQKEEINAEFTGNMIEKVNGTNGSTSEFQFQLINETGEVKFIKEL